MQSIALIFFSPTVFWCVPFVSVVQQLHVRKCVDPHRLSLCVECVCVCTHLSGSYSTHISLSLSPARRSGTQLADCASQSSLQTDGERGEKREKTRVKKKTSSEGEATVSKDFDEGGKTGCEKLRIKKKGL